MNKLLMAAMDTYQAQKTEALAHLDLIAKDELMEILEKYGMNEKTIKRLLK